MNLKDNNIFTESLSENQGIILVFIPNVVSITSSIQLKNIRKNYYKFKNLGWEVICVSTSSKDEIENYKSNNSINFSLIPDDDLKISKLFGVIHQNSQSDQWQAMRKSFILTEKQILFELDKVRPISHCEDLLNWIEMYEEKNTSHTVQIMKNTKAKSGE